MIGMSEKRSQDAEEFDQKIKILIVDIEGTTTSISFVKDTLFPYIRENLKVYLKSHWKEPEFVEDLTLLRKQAESDKENGVEGLVPIPAGNDEEICQAVLNNILWQMDLDRKTKALKQLQGHVMREGYLNGKLKGHVYDDVQPALKSWKHSGRQVYVYSSGSVAAQKLLFEFSEKGDLLEFFSGHFDTDVGSKIESSSYSNIAKQLNCKCEEIMFLTDIPKEAMAAREAGLHPVLVVRPGNAPLSDDDCHKFRVIKSFDDIVFEASAKRTKLSVEESTTNKVSDESSDAVNSSMQMDVDVEDSCPKVSEGATLTSESKEKSQKSEEVPVLQNGSAQKENSKEKGSSGENEVNKAPVAEKDASSKQKTDSDVSSKIENSIERMNSEKNEVNNSQKTENSLNEKEKVVEKSKTSDSTKTVGTEDKIVGEIVKEETKCDSEKMETDGCTVKSENSEEKSAIISEETKKTADRTEGAKSDGSLSETVTRDVAGDSKSVESDTTAGAPNETKSVDSMIETKTAPATVSSEETKAAPATDSSSKESKTAPATDSSSKESKTAPATDSSSKESKTAPATDSSSKESKTVPATDSSSKESKTVPATDSSSKESKTAPATDSSSKESKTAPPTDSSSKESKTTPATDSSSKESKTAPATDSSSKESKTAPATDSLSKESKTAPATDSSSKESKTPPATDSSSEENKTAPTADSSEETKTASAADSSSEETKTAPTVAASSEEIKTATAASSDATKTAEIDEAKTAPTAKKEKTASDVGEEKTVESPCEKKEVDSVEVESTSKDSKELKASDEDANKTESRVPEKIESNIPEESKVIAEKTSEIIKNETIEIAKEATETYAPEVAEEVKASDKVTTEIAEEIKASDKVTIPKVPQEIKPVDIAEVKVPEITEKAKTPEGTEEVKAQEITENAKDEKEIASQAKPLESVNEALPSKTVDAQTTKSVDEMMECEEESKTDASIKPLKTLDATENNVPQIAEEIDMEESTDGSKNEKNILKKDSKDSKREECKSLENTEEKMVTDSCQEKLTEKDNQSKGDKINKLICTENGETDVEMETATPDSSDVDQKVENKICDNEVTKVAEGNKSSDLQSSSTKQDEAMETDGQDSETIDKDAPMDVESTEISAGNGENVKEVESKTNGINNSHTASPAKNDTNMKILDNESIKFKKNEESEAAKLITPPSVQS